MRVREDIVFSVKELDIEPRQAWGAAVADFDRDGLEDILLEGHSPASGDRIYYRRGNTYEPSPLKLPSGSDRHDCAAADADQDGWLDLYCSAGAARGTGGNSNEYLLGKDGTDFKAYEGIFGAEDTFGRGRLTAFLNYNGDAYPDLFVTVWGTRNDGQTNESSIYKNLGGTFARSSTQATGDWGGRCLWVDDINRDGLDDLVVCGQEEGGHILLNNRAGDFVRTTPADSDFWWIDAKTGDLNRDGLEDLVILTANGQLQIRLASEVGPVFSHVTRKVETRLLPGGTRGDSYGAGFALYDMDSDGNLDIYLIRRVGPLKDSLAGDASDLVIFGPEFFSYAAVPLARSGQGYLALTTADGIIRLNSGKRWVGSVELVTTQP